MWERRAWLLSDPKYTEKLHRLYCHGGPLAALCLWAALARPSCQHGPWCWEGSHGKPYRGFLSLGLRAEFRFRPLSKLCCRYADAWLRTSLILADLNSWLDLEPVLSLWSGLVVLGLWLTPVAVTSRPGSPCSGAVGLSVMALPASPPPLSPACLPGLEQPSFSLLARTACSSQGGCEKRFPSSREMCFLVLLHK